MTDEQVREHIHEDVRLHHQSAVGEEQGSEDRATNEAEREVEQFELDAQARTVSQARQNLHAYHVTLGAAGQSIDRVIGEVVAIAMLITWNPSQEDEIQQRIAAVAHNLDGFQSLIREVSAARRNLAASDAAHDFVQDRDDHYVATIDAFRQLRRQLTGFISVLESDVANTPALAATARAVSEAEYVANLRARGLSIFLERAGVAT